MSESILDQIMDTKHQQDIARFDPQEVVAELFRQLSDREQEVLRRRFGLTGEKKQTLEHIGKKLGVTRERIRQIESLGVDKLKSAKNFKSVISPVENVVLQIMEEHGGVMEEEYLLKTILQTPGDSPVNRRVMIFFLNQLLNNTFARVKGDEQLKKGWKLKLTSLDFIILVINQVNSIITAINEPIDQDELLSKFKETDFYQSHSEKLADDVIISYLTVSKKIGKNIFNEWGLTSWGLIAPRRMNDKIYLILKHHEKPLHFTEIADMINKAKFDKRVANAPTVHNELILDKKYVLVGRGIYALNEWGYKKGVVSDIIAEVLQSSEKPLDKSEIIDRVLKQRMVSQSTVNLGLMDKSKFKKNSDGSYQLVEQLSTEAPAEPTINIGVPSEEAGISPETEPSN